MSNKLSIEKNLLQEDDYIVWTRYIDALSKNIKSSSSKSLEEFLISIDAYSDSKKEEIANCLLNQINSYKDLKFIQYPLFDKLIYPILVRGYLNNNKKILRYLIACEQYFLSNTALRQNLLSDLSLEKFDVEFFANKLLEIDSEDIQSTDLLINILNKKLNYWSHEENGLLVERNVFVEYVEKFERLLQVNCSSDDHRLENLKYYKSFLRPI